MSLWSKLFGSEEARHGASPQTKSVPRPDSGPFDLRAEQARLLRAIKRRWAPGVEFYAGDAFSLISKEYLDWFTAEASRKRMYCINHRETATLELLESFRTRGLLTKRVAVTSEGGDEGWYYKLPGVNYFQGA